MVKNPFSPGSSPQEFSTRKRRACPASSMSTPVKSIAWFIADSPVFTRCSFEVEKSTPNRLS